MEIERINSYRDARFSQKVLNQHGCFLVDGSACEVEILSGSEAVIRGGRPEAFPDIIEEFRFFTPHITVFYDENRNILLEFPPAKVFQVALEDIQPSQFYVDADKVQAVSTFLRSGEDIVIQALAYEGRYIALDGHTRLFYAAKMGWKTVNAVLEASGDYIYAFVKEAVARNVRSPYDLKLLSHGEYEVRWHRFCEDFFAGRGG